MTKTQDTLAEQLDMRSIWDEGQPEQTIPNNHDVVPYLTPREIILMSRGKDEETFILGTDEGDGWGINEVVSRALQELSQLRRDKSNLDDDLSTLILLLYIISEDLDINLDELTNKIYWDLIKQYG